LIPFKAVKRSNGFTLVEAAVAIGVVAILAGIIIPLVLKTLRDARNARARNDIQVIVAAIASQLKDTGRRPVAEGGAAVGNADGGGDNLWFSGGVWPRKDGVPMDFAGHTDQYNSFVNLFSWPGRAGNQMFGLRADAEAQYQGAYLAADVARQSDPWGRSYLILGYNLRGQNSRGPIWVISAGKSGNLAGANMNVGNDGAPVGVPAGQHVPVWDYTLAGAATNIAVRVN
jgi:type II secretory pathway pseudopilin PulG